jgi:D-alanyl-D-alanine carboxypeptidase
MKSIVTILFLLIFNYTFAQSKLQTVLNKYKDSINGYGITVLENKDNKVNKASIGFAAEKMPILNNNLFCIGSCTKMFTATIILKLFENGQLQLSDSISKYLPTYKNIDSNISIQQLLSHRSGICDFTKKGFANKPLKEPYADYSDDYILNLLDTIDFVKNEKYTYSNTNYFLLRKIIEAVMDRPYENVLTDLILKPFKLNNTLPYYSAQTIGLAHPFINGQDLNEIPKMGSNTISRGIGNIVSNTNDLNLFIRLLLVDKKILKPATLQLMTNFIKTEKKGVGLGLFEEKFSNVIVWGHTGRQISYLTYCFVNPKTKSSYIVMANDANDIYAKKILTDILNAK